MGVEEPAAVQRALPQRQDGQHHAGVRVGCRQQQQPVQVDKEECLTKGAFPEQSVRCGRRGRLLKVDIRLRVHKVDTQWSDRGGCPQVRHDMRRDKLQQDAAVERPSLCLQDAGKRKPYREGLDHIPDGITRLYAQIHQPHQRHTARVQAAEARQGEAASQHKQGREGHR